MEGFPTFVPSSQLSVIAHNFNLQKETRINNGPMHVIRFPDASALARQQHLIQTLGGRHRTERSLPASRRLLLVLAGFRSSEALFLNNSFSSPSAQLALQSSLLAAVLGKKAGKRIPGRAGYCFRDRRCYFQGYCVNGGRLFLGKYCLQVLGLFSGYIKGH